MNFTWEETILEPSLSIKIAFYYAFFEGAILHMMHRLHTPSTSILLSVLYVIFIGVDSHKYMV